MTTLAFPDTTGKPTDGSFTYEANGVIYSWTGDYWAANNAQGFDQRYVNADGDQMTGDLTVPSLNGGPLAGFRNQIINGCFRIAQRGIAVTETTSGYRTLDRWFVGRSASCEEEQVNSVALEQEAGTSKSMRLNPGNAAFIRQFVEIERGRAGCFQPGTTWTLSFYSNREGNVVDVGFSGAVAGDYVLVMAQTEAERIGTTNRYKVTFTVPNPPNGNCVALRVSIQPTSTQYTDFTGIQLEPGSVATPFEHRPNGLEMQLCQRYYVESDKSLFSTQWNCGVFTKRGMAHFFFPVEMRKAPTINNVNYSNATQQSAPSADTKYVTFQLNSTLSDASNCSAVIAGVTFDAEL